MYIVRMYLFIPSRATTSEAGRGDEILDDDRCRGEIPKLVVEAESSMLIGIV